ETQAAAQALGVELHVLGGRSPHDFKGAFAAVTSGSAGALLVMRDGLLNGNCTRIVAFAQQHGRPGMYSVRNYVDTAAIMSYAPIWTAMSPRAATYVDKILKGAKPADLPVEQPTKFELVINLKTVKALGITMPSSLLLLADEVIQ